MESGGGCSGSRARVCYDFPLNLCALHRSTTSLTSMPTSHESSIPYCEDQREAACIPRSVKLVRRVGYESSSRSQGTPVQMAEATTANSNHIWHSCKSIRQPAKASTAGTCVCTNVCETVVWGQITEKAMQVWAEALDRWLQRLAQEKSTMH